MGITKTEIYSSRQNTLAEWLKALAHPARISILETLSKSKHCICGDLVGELGLAQSTVSQHLQALKKAGIIKACEEGTTVSYCIDEKIMKRFKKDWDDLFKKMGNPTCTK